eukprot:evm.model.scf_651.6 EVM.evm.TU.scf_651.6   scf_651:62226-64538(+)
MGPRGGALSACLLLAACLGAWGCDVWGNCKACTRRPSLQAARRNMDAVLEFLGSRQCGDWKGLRFRTVVFRGQMFTSCQTFDGHKFPGGSYSTCAEEEDVEVRLDQDVAIDAEANTTKWLAQDGQFECEPDGTVLFNRGPGRHAGLDDLHEPHKFRPHNLDWPLKSPMVGFQVFGHGTRVNRDCYPICTHYCYDVPSAFLVIYDIVDKNDTSVLPVVTAFQG